MTATVNFAQQEARARLESLIPRGSTVYCVRENPQGGASHIFRLYVTTYDPITETVGMHSIGGSVAALLDRKVSPLGGVRTRGLGMDMAQDLVRGLAVALYGDDNALKQSML